jgi:HlyD family secretion protein
MDKIIVEEVSRKKRKNLVIISIVVIAVMVLAVLTFRSVLGSSLKRSDITTSVVERGDIENTITASGQILPEFEQVIASPISASIQNVLVDAGKPVQEGQSILMLDKSISQSEYEKLKFQLESKRNEIQKLRVDLNQSFSSLQSSNKLKQLRINSLKSSLEDAKRLYNAGGGTREDVEQAELALKVAMQEKAELENQLHSNQQTMRIQMKESEIAASIQENDLRELERKLQLANIVATRPGVITWVNKNIGTTVQPGESLVKIADLGSFKLSGTLSDSYIDQLHTGMPAIIKINDQQFRGTVSSINPSIQNGLIAFDVQLEIKNNALYRPNMKVDIFLVTDVHKNVLRVANGPAFKSGLTQEVFVLNGNKAERRIIHTGLSNFDFVELKDNIKAGETVITSDMSNYKNTKEITINN